jgi:hypothetical protein
MVKCNNDEKDITSDKFGAKFGISIITIIYFIFILFIIGIIISIQSTNKTIIKKSINASSTANIMSQILTYIKSLSNGKFSEKTTKYADNFVGRFTEWFTKVGNSINSGSVLAILAAGVVIGFNNLIMTPLITTMFPENINVPMEIPGRNASVNPGQFFIALIGFILSLILFFFIAEFIYIIKRHFKNKLTIGIIFLLFIFLTFMLVWNAIQTHKLINQPDCVPIGTKTSAFQFKNNGIDSQYPLIPFGIFG